MPVLSFCKSLFLFTIFSAAFQCSLQDTLSCGATSFQVSFEPSRPQFGGGSSNIGIGSSAKYTFQQLETILKNGQQVCNLSMSSTVQPLMFDPQQQIMRQQSPAAPLHSATPELP
uniref:Uncharacterized protein n=1 Tax=Ditylenchus dipsaci TaxID=166011 RepID=A0A915CP43_9BILA